MKEPIAIIGMSCRLPGGANSPAAYWKMLCDGTDAIQEIPADRWNIDAHYDTMPGRAGKSTSKWGGFIDQIDRFDSSFFGISAREADAMDPQQRMLLETTWEAFEDAGQKWEELRGSSTGVFVGISGSDYLGMQYKSVGSSDADAYSAPGCAFSIAANRISYCFDLRGPSIAMDTACSSALTACHVACQSLWQGDCQMAVVAGVNALLNQTSFVAFSRMSMLSPDGRCKAFDARANGFVRSEGVGVVLLKPLSAAMKDGDRIDAVIRATAANQDGRTNGITVPSQQAQEALIRKACKAAGISPAEVSYVEAHGTGTAVGDPIETAALGAALGEGRSEPCLIGSVKTNIGHLESASGVASLIKVALILKHKQIPPSIHFSTPNPHIDFAGMNLRVAEQMQEFPHRGRAMLAGINSFGFGGANAHVIMGAAPTPIGEALPGPAALDRLVLPLAAHNSIALQQAAANYSAVLSREECDVRSLCGAVANRRSGFAHRLCIAAGSGQELAQRLKEFASGETGPAIAIGEAIGNEGPVFVCAGQGTQWWAMGRELLREQPVFRARIEECDGIFRSFAPWSLVEELSKSEEESQLHMTAIAQPAIFALQVALAALWNSWGIQPEAVVGHSVGEAAAAFIAGALTLLDAARVICHRGRTMDPASNRGRMLAAALTAEQAEEMVAPYGGDVEVGAYNSPTSVTLTGEPKPLEQIAKILDGQGVFHRFLKVNYAFHSHQMDAVKDDLLASLGQLEVSTPRIPLYSTVSGSGFKEGDFNAEYWWQNVRRPVRFTEAIAGLSAQGHKLFLELGAHPALTTSIAETLSASSAPGKAFYSLRRAEPETETMLRSLGSLFVAGATIDWTKIYSGNYSQVELPGYPWQHEKHWRETRAANAARLAATPHFFLSGKLDAGGPVWNGSLDIGAHPWFRDHRVLDHILLPGAAMIETVLEAGAEMFGDLPIEVEETEFREALVLPESKEPVELQAAYSAVDSSLRFSSRRLDEKGGWTLHTTAKVRKQAAVSFAKVDIAQIKKSLLHELDSDEIYKICRQHGLEYGPAFRGLTYLWRNKHEALGKIELPEELTTTLDKFQLHPVILDACFQAVGFAAPVIDSRRASVPVGVNRLVLLAKPGKSVYCHTKLVQFSQRAGIWNFQICDEDGNVLVDVEGIRSQVIRGASKTRVNDPAQWLYESKWIEQPLDCGDGKQEEKPEGKWLILSDRAGVGAELAALLGAHGAEPHLLYPDSYLSKSEAGGAERNDCFRGDLRAILSEEKMQGRKLAGIVHLWSLDAPTNDLDGKSFEEAEALTCHSLLEIVRTLSQENSALPVKIVTRVAQSVSEGERVSVAQSLSIGMGRVMMAELQRMSFRLIDLGGDDVKAGAHHLWRELTSADHETEVAWRGETRYANRIVQRPLDSLPALPLPANRAGYTLQLPAAGVMDDLAWCETPRRRPAAHEIEIAVEAAAINFRDILKTLGLYPMEHDRDLLLGDECSGRVTAVGKSVTTFKPGDAVIASAAGCFSSHIVVPAACAIRKPARISFEDAATIPVAFMTAWYALHRLGQLKRGESVLIHSAAGGVGLAAMQIARLAGAQIYATAGSEEKRRYLRKMGAREVFDSRTTAFAAGIRRATKGRGVDLVLNSLAGDAIAKGLSLLAPGGRFLEIGKRDVYANTAVGLRPLRNNVSMHVIDMGQIMAESPRDVQEMLSNLMKLLRNGSLQALPHSDVPFSQAIEAFRQMAQARHIGKIVLTAKGDHVTPLRKLPQEHIKLSGKGSYLITGGLGGFGLQVACGLVFRGARHLVLASRSGAATLEAKRAVSELRSQGARVTVAKIDVADERSVGRLVRKIAADDGPLRGIFHAAAVLDDGILMQMTPARMARVLAPKAAGAWHLHRASLGIKLDYFVLFSSVASLLGTPGQANYAAANCFLDALAHYRKSLGLPALAVNWGAIKDVGMLARNRGLAENLAARGVEGIAPDEAVEILGRLLQTECTHIGCMHIDWQKSALSSPGAPPAPRFSEVIAVSATSEADDSTKIRTLIHSTSPAQRLAVTAALICETTSAIMRIDAKKLDVGRPLNEMGLDSLMAFELINRLEDRFGISLPTSSISSSSTVNSMAAMVLESYGLGETADATQAEDAAHAERTDQAIVLRAGDENRPLFFIHPLGGGTEIYAELVAQLPDGLCVYGIESRLLAGHQHEWASLDELARNYADIAEQLQPHGSMRIAGFSAGGIFALATALELERRGRCVSFVGTIEAPFLVLDPEQPKEAALKSVILDLLDGVLSVQGAPGGSALVDFEESTMEIARRLISTSVEDEQLSLLMDWAGSRGIDFAEHRAGISGVTEIFRRMVRHLKLLNNCSIESLTAPVWSWRADKSEITGTDISALMRRSITDGQFKKSLIDGRHFEVMKQPWVGALARQFAAALAQSEQPDSAEPVLVAAAEGGA